MKELSAILAEYRITEVHGDRYAGMFPRELFENDGVSYLVSELNRSELNLELLPLVMSGKCRLLSNQNLLNQLASWEHKTSRAGKDSTDHPPGGHDDLANSVAGAVFLAKAPPGFASPILGKRLASAEFAADDFYDNPGGRYADFF